MLGLDHAIAVAAAAHDGQKNSKNGEIYILHPLWVSRKLAPFGVAAQITGVLHDTVEDTNLTLDNIEEKFGRAIRNGVDAVTKRKGETYEQSIERAADDPLGILAKIMDLGHNMAFWRMAEEEADPEKEIARVIKYRKARRYLIKIARERYGYQIAF